MRINKAESVVAHRRMISALGEPDDHLRLAVLLAKSARSKGEQSVDVQACIEAWKWSEKFEALKRLLRSPTLDGLVFQDMDALWHSRADGPGRWDDSQFRRERRDLFDVLLDAAGRRRWRLRRPVPAKGARIGSHLAPPVPLDRDDPSALASVAPEIRPLARCLVEREIMASWALDELVEAAQALKMDPAESLIARADEALTVLGRDAALRISLLRVDQKWNGVIGPYRMRESALADDEVDVHALDRAAVGELVSLGLLHVSGDRARMPRMVRHYYAIRAASTGDINAEAEHRLIAGRLSSARSARLTIERHHHAIGAEDADLAFQTAKYYVNDLRRLAIRLSRRGGRANHRQAALIFRRITRKDPTDAYAWEYYGYNLALYDPKTAGIESAYLEACELEPENPLYRGRLVGWRAFEGADVTDEACHRIMNEYGPTSVAASWFAYQVLGGLRRGRRREQLDRLQERLGARRVNAWSEKRCAPE